MGVMSCSRKDCGNIMCDTYNESVGYICYECQNEFKVHLKNNNIVLDTERKIIEELKVFMETSKDTYSDINMSVDEFFNKNGN
jgi:hypothetical protein